MKVAVIGANGQLGTDVVRAFADNGDEVCALTHADIEIANLDSVHSALGGLQPQVIVNTAAMHHVENCELEPERAFAVNALGPMNLARVAQRSGRCSCTSVPTTSSTGAREARTLRRTLPGRSTSTGIANWPGSILSAARRKAFCGSHSGLYGKRPCRAKGGLNFVELMLKLARGAGRGAGGGQRGGFARLPLKNWRGKSSCLSRSRLLRALPRHGRGHCSWFEFAREIFALTNTKVSLKVAAPNEFPAKVPRPSYSVLENRALKTQGLNKFEPWQNGLREYLDQRVAVSL